MAVFLLTWNPEKWTDPKNWVSRAIAETAAGNTFPSNWSTGSRNSEIEEGDLGFIVRQHNDRGIVAWVEFSSEIYQDAHWDGTPGKVANFADTEIIDWLEPEDRLPVEYLEDQVPSVNWDHLQGSGVKVSEEDGERLVDLWVEHLESQGRGKPEIAEELNPYGTYPEGSLSRIIVNRYERNSNARSACINHYGTACVICGFDFEARYGEAGSGFIHVHHLKEVSALPEDYQVDPIADLRPICPNCHAMLHRTKPAMSPDQLKASLR